MRIVSLLPSATEIVCALGLDENLVGVSHECDYPAHVETLPRLTRNALPLETMTLAEIDAAVAARLREGDAIYEIDANRLRALAPDVIITQDLCEVCAPSSKDLAGILADFAAPPRVLGFSPNTIAGIFENIATLGEVAGCTERADRWIAESHRRLGEVAAAVAGRPRRRVFCMEWIDPPYCSGHWVPEMVEIAGGVDEVSRKGADSVRVAWSEVCTWAPEVLLVMPCGFGLKEAVHQAEALPRLPGWSDLPAVQAQQVYAVDANAFFARPGPRVVDGVELLARLIHPEIAWSAMDGAVRLRTKACSACDAPFLCLPVDGCWCEDVCVGSGTLKALGERYDDCLCPVCLSQAARTADASPALAR